MTTRIKKAHVGRPVDFKSSQVDDAPLNGVIERVKNGVAAVRFYVVRDLEGHQRAFDPEGFVAYLDVRDERIIEVF